LFKRQKTDRGGDTGRRRKVRKGLAGCGGPNEPALGGLWEGAAKGARQHKKKEVRNLRKFIALFIGVLTVFGLAATAMAIHAEIPAETQAVVAKGATQIMLSGNIRVRGWYLNDIESTRVPADTGSAAYYDERVRLQLDAALGGVTGRIHLESNGGSSDTWTWGTNSFNQKPTDMQILEAWIQYTGEGLGFKSGIKAGHMPLSLGPKTLFFDHTKFGDDAIVLFADPSPNTHIGLLTIKAIENSSFDNTDDVDIYVGLINQKFGDHTLGAYYVYANQSDPGTSLQDIGLHAMGKFAGLSYTAQADFNMGELVDVPGLSIDASGWGAWLELAYKLDPVTIRVMGAYGSGDDNPADDDVETFINFLSGSRYYTVVYDYQVVGANGARFQGISNTTVLNAGLDFKPMNKLSLSLDGYWLQASEENAAGEDELGWEVDLKGTYELAKNLKYFVWAGYFDAGDFYGADPESPSVVMHGLELAF
jgi:predicted porin